MFIAEQPFISDLFLEKLEKLQSPVLQTPAVREFNAASRRLNLLEPDAFFERLRQNPSAPLYCNSENGLRWIAERAPETAFAKKVELFKNKAKFRRALAKIYPDFYFREVDFDELQTLEYRDLPQKFVLKPSVGFLSLGVRFVSSESDWETAKRETLRDRAANASLFPPEVVDLSRFLIEEAVDGDEIAVDAYFSADGTPVVLDVLRHPFFDANDVRDRVYATSPQLVRDLLPTIEATLTRIGAATEEALAETSPRRSTASGPFPFHFEFRVDGAGNAIPIELNPGRFAGWHTTELASYAYNIDVYDCFVNQKRPDWNRVLNETDADATTFFAIFERPETLDPDEIEAFDYDALGERFSRLFELRRIDFRRRSIFAIAFAQTKNRQELNEILALDVERFVRFKKR